MRLDFDRFNIAGPTTVTAIVTRRIKQSGAIGSVPAATIASMLVPVSAMGQCQTDTFSVTNGNGPRPPTICGLNTGQHSESNAKIFFVCLLKFEIGELCKRWMLCCLLTAKGKLLTLKVDKSVEYMCFFI